MFPTISSAGFDMREGITFYIGFYREEQDTLGADAGCLPAALRSQESGPRSSDNWMGPEWQVAVSWMRRCSEGG